jgi:hypothetical protein
MPSEKMRYLKNRPRPPYDYKDIKLEIKNFTRENIEEMLLNFSICSIPLRRTLIIMTATNRFKKDRDISALQEVLLYALNLEDHIPYDRAGEYRFIIYPVIEFFIENRRSKKLMDLLEEILPVLENFSYHLQDEGSWYEAYEELSELYRESFIE